MGDGCRQRLVHRASKRGGGPRPGEHGADALAQEAGQFRRQRPGAAEAAQPRRVVDVVEVFVEQADARKGDDERVEDASRAPGNRCKGIGNVSAPSQEIDTPVTGTAQNRVRAGRKAGKRLLQVSRLKAWRVAADRDDLVVAQGPDVPQCPDVPPGQSPSPLWHDARSGRQARGTGVPDDDEVGVAGRGGREGAVAEVGEHAREVGQTLDARLDERGAGEQQNRAADAAGRSGRQDLCSSATRAVRNGGSAGGVNQREHYHVKSITG